MLRPNFLLTKTVPLTIYRKTQGSYVDGEWVDGTETEVALNVNIQPLKPSELLQLPESERTKQWYKVYCADEIRTELEGASGWDADEFVWQGSRYRVMKSKNYAMSTLDHYCVYAARISLTPN